METRERLFLAGLLHDVGKLGQRADDKSYEFSSMLRKYEKDIVQSICPYHKAGKYFSHIHVVYTLYFLHQIEKVWRQSTSAEQQDNLINLAIYHHKPETKWQTLVQLADHWASGIERNDSPSENSSGGNYKKVALQSVFDALLISQKSSETQHYILPTALHNENIAFPEKREKADNLQPLFATVWKNFCQEAVALFSEPPQWDFASLSFTLHHLLKKYLSYVPAATQEAQPDISLFEHSKMVGALALCLYDYQAENETHFYYNENQKAWQLAPNHYPVLLVCVELSGIQRFLYDIHNSGAAKSLKGRSFYLQNLLQGITQQFITDLQQTWSNVVYSSGGKFYMLLPHTQQVKNYLTNWQKEIEKALWQTHQDKLYVAVGYTAFAYQKQKLHTENGEEGLSQLWKSVSDKTAQQKQKKWWNLLQNSDFFEPQLRAGKLQTCAVTGERLPEKEMQYIKEDDYWLKNSVYQQTELGKQLKDTNWIAFSYQKENEPFELLQNSKLPYLNCFSALQKLPQKAFCWKYNEATLQKIENPKNIGYGFMMYGGNSYPVDEKEKRPLYFSDLAAQGQLNKLAILRMDVDGLGDIFIRGIDKEKRNFSRYATLSGSLDMFFSGYLNHIRQQPQYAQKVQIVYSGGDDVFAVGEWQATLAMAEEIREALRKFVGRNDLTLSAGIALITPKFPIAKAAEIAGEAEEKAKKHTTKNQEKNSITWLDYPLNWDSEWTWVKAKKDILKEKIKEEEISSGFLFLLQQLEVQRQDAEKNKTPHTWMWQCTYNLARRRKKDKHEFNAWLETLIKDLTTNAYKPKESNYLSVTLWAIAARWAELEMRNLE